MDRFPRTLLTAVVAAVLALPTTAASQATSDAEAGIAAGTEAWTAAWNSADAAGLAALYADDAIVLAPGAEPAEGHAAILAFFESSMEAGTPQVALETREVESYGDIAIEVGSFVMTGEDGAHVDHGKYIAVWKNVDGSWKMVRDIWNSSMTP